MLAADCDLQIVILESLLKHLSLNFKNLCAKLPLQRSINWLKLFFVSFLVRMLQEKIHFQHYMFCI